MSSKNILQEYCQKHHTANPEYATVCTTTPPALPVFQCTLKFRGVQYEGSGSTRINAEKDAAAKACVVLEQSVFPPIARSMIDGPLIRPEQFTCPLPPVPPVAPPAANLVVLDPAIIAFRSGARTLTQKFASILDIPSSAYQTIYLIDGDSCHVENESKFSEAGSLFVYFVAKNTTKPSPADHQHRFENCCIFISDSIGRDAADHLLTFTLGQMTAIWHGKKYIIATHDHFGECLEKFVPGCQCICSL